MNPSDLLTVRVDRKTHETARICSIDLVPADPGATLPAFSAGAHIDLHLPGGIVRQYSLYGSPAERHRYRIAVLRESASRGGSLAVHDRLTPGFVLPISPPRNAFALDPDASAHLLLGGGIGLTPLVAMAEALYLQGKPFELHLCARSRDSLPLRGHLARVPWAASVRLHLDDEPQTALALGPLLEQSPSGCHLAVCGPAGFMDWVRAGARAAHWPAERIRSESFNAVPTAAGDDGAFEIELASSGRCIRVEPGQTALEALQAAGVALASSCAQGVCGTCMTRIVSGVPDHRDLYLTPDERAANDCFLPCCSRALSGRLVVAL